MHAPVGYLVTTVLLGVWTFFAVAPPRPRHSSPSNRSYWFGYLLNELPFVAFYWLAASTGLALSEGVTGSWVGRTALAVAAATTAGLALVAWRGLQARRSVDAALDEALGPRWRDTIDSLRSTSSSPIAYAELPGGQHTFDLFESLRFASVIDGIEAFAAQIRSRRRAFGRAVGVPSNLQNVR
jgi:hypothetical protein